MPTFCQRQNRRTYSVVGTAQAAPPSGTCLTAVKQDFRAHGTDSIEASASNIAPSQSRRNPLRGQDFRAHGAGGTGESAFNIALGRSRRNPLRGQDFRARNARHCREFYLHTFFPDRSQRDTPRPTPDHLTFCL